MTHETQLDRFGSIHITAALITETNKGTKVHLKNNLPSPYFRVWQPVVPDLRGITIKFANLILEGLFIMNLYQLDKQSTKFTIWKY